MTSSDPYTERAPEKGAPDVESVPVDAPEAYAISRELAQATLNYLAAQPYREVFALVQGFEALVTLPKAASGRNGHE